MQGKLVIGGSNQTAAHRSVRTRGEGRKIIVVLLMAAWALAVPANAIGGSDTVDTLGEIDAALSAESAPSTINTKPQQTRPRVLARRRREARPTGRRS